MHKCNSISCQSVCAQTQQVLSIVNWFQRNAHRNLCMTPPFQCSGSLFRAALVIIKSLDEVSNLKSGRQQGKLSPAALCAVLLGQRLATPDYLHAIMALDSKQFLLKKEASALPPSIKFDSVARRRPLRVCVEDCFKTAHCRCSGSARSAVEAH